MAKLKKDNKPLRSSLTFFINAIKNHTRVSEVSEVEEHVYEITRTGNRSPLKILVAAIYIASEADIFELKGLYPELDCIVLIGYYNRYSGAAKLLAKRNDIGLFDFREFFGAINFVGQKFLDYEPKTADNWLDFLYAEREQNLSFWLLLNFWKTQWHRHFNYLWQKANRYS